MIYKILRQPEWRAAIAQGKLTGSPVDTADGYIHFSTVRQVRETAARHFHLETDLVLLVVDPEALGPDLRWEPSRGGDLFPHLYAVLPLDRVLASYPLPLGRDGLHVFAAAGL
ncbi:MAG: DUF952 domain-containing protein [Alphaproteobacteria bacterium]|nr:DUF952 domain-containing protein [Alphaproteobacteria bacterium]